MTQMTHDEWAAQDPCEECGGRPGYDPSSGIDLKQGHYSSCSHWSQVPNA